MGFIREPEGVDFIIAPSLAVKDDIAYISRCIQQQKAKEQQYESVKTKPVEQKS
jgi:hypothetical protein